MYGTRAARGREIATIPTGILMLRPSFHKLNATPATVADP
jgi:hypothetical protein